MVFEKRETKQLGLTVWFVYVNGTRALGPFASPELAETKIKACLHAWNVEKIQTKKAG